MFAALLCVKQGDPLSPLLFGLLIDHLEPFLTTLHPTIGARVLDTFINLLLFADDLCLIADSPEDLQTLLNSLHSFCTANRLTVNPTKSEVVAFNLPPTLSPHFSFGGSTIPLRPSFVYLGIQFDGAKALKDAWRRNAEKGARASFLVSRRANTLEIHTPHMRACIFNTMALPVIAYGCEVWGPQALTLTSTSTHLDRILLAFLKRSLGLAPSTPTSSLKAELSFTRITSRILKRTLKFHNCLLKRPDSDLAKMALIENKQMARDGVSCWSLHLHKTLSRDTSFTNSLSPALTPFTLEPKRALTEREEKLDRALFTKASNLQITLAPNTSIRSIPSNIRTGFKALKHQLWMLPDPDPTNRYTHHLHNKTLIHTLARFRMSMHSLRCERGRPLPRDQRTCQLCDSNCVEDEFHLLTCPAYTHIRSAPEFKKLTSQWPPSTTAPPDSVIHTVMNPSPRMWHPLALLIHRCMTHRQTQLDLLAPPL